MLYYLEDTWWDLWRRHPLFRNQISFTTKIIKECNHANTIWRQNTLTSSKLIHRQKNMQSKLIGLSSTLETLLNTSVTWSNCCLHPTLKWSLKLPYINCLCCLWIYLSEARSYAKYTQKQKNKTKSKNDNGNPNICSSDERSDWERMWDWQPDFE